MSGLPASAKHNSSYPSSLPQIEQVKVAKLLGVILAERLHFDDHILAVLKACMYEDVGY